jgi:hypothetical protein
VTNITIAVFVVSFICLALFFLFPLVHYCADWWFKDRRTAREQESVPAETAPQQKDKP